MTHNKLTVGLVQEQWHDYAKGHQEDFYFKPGDSDYPVHQIAEHRLGFPTCYDQWFPELSRIYGLKGAELDFSQRKLWWRLFPFAQQRKLATYTDLVRLR